MIAPSRLVGGLGMEYFVGIFMEDLQQVREIVVWDGDSMQTRRVRVEYYASSADLVGHYSRLSMMVSFQICYETTA